MKDEGLAPRAFGSCMGEGVSLLSKASFSSLVERRQEP